MDPNLDRKRKARDGIPPRKVLRRASTSSTTASDLQKHQPEVSHDLPAWSPEIHRALIEAIFDVGIGQASPVVILENMTLPVEDLNTERIKSHLQKYRKNKEKSRVEFLREYDEWMRKAMTFGGGSTSTSSSGAGIMAPPASVVNIIGDPKLLGGVKAAFLTHSVLAEEQERDRRRAAAASRTSTKTAAEEQHDTGTTILPRSTRCKFRDRLQRSSKELLACFSGATIPFPRLTEAERSSPLGESLAHVMGLVISMTHYLMAERLGMESISLEEDARDQKQQEEPSTVSINKNKQEKEQQQQQDEPFDYFNHDGTARNAQVVEDDNAAMMEAQEIAAAALVAASMAPGRRYRPKQNR